MPGDVDASDDTIPYDFVALPVLPPPGHEEPIVFTCVDRVDAEKLKCERWRLSSDGYVVRDVKQGGKTKTVRLHREIMTPSEGRVVDHVNGYRLNNLRRNLRPATVGQNNANSAPRRPDKYRGVYWVEKLGKYRVKLTAGGKSIHVGLFENEHEAALAYNEAARHHHGEFARLNDVPETPSG